jgi:hypothetical protein
MIYRISPFQNQTILDIILHGTEVHGKEMAGMAFCPMFTDLQNEESDLVFELSEQESLDLAETIEASLDHLEEPYLTIAEGIAQNIRRLVALRDDITVHPL